MEGAEERNSLEEYRLTETEAILDALPHPTFAINSDFQIIRMNRAALMLTGEERYPDAIGQSCHVLIHQRDDRCPFCPIFEDYHEDNDQHLTPLEKIIQAKDPKNPTLKERTLRLTFIRPARERIDLVETIEDITFRQEKQEEDLRRENLAALGTMISGIAHELNNPLTGMGLTLQNLIANLSAMNGDEIHKRLNLLVKDLKRASRIVSDILSFSRPGELRLTQADIRQTIKKASTSIQRLYPVLSRRVNWIFEGEKDVIMEFHPEKIERLFFNLFRNSIQAFDYSEGYIRIDIRRAKKNIHIVIEDNAGGIAAEELGKIFNPFFSRNKSGAGSGLGLSICHSIVKEHRGRIRASSSSGKTQFLISLPLNRNGS